MRSPAFSHPSQKIAYKAVTGKVVFWWLSRCHPRHVQPVEALPRVLEIEPLLENILVPETIERVADGPWWKIGFFDDIFLR